MALVNATRKNNFSQTQQLKRFFSSEPEAKLLPPTESFGLQPASKLCWITALYHVSRPGNVMHQSAASPWGPPPETLGDLAKRPFKPHQIPLGIGQRNSDKSPPPGCNNKDQCSR